LAGACLLCCAALSHSAKAELAGSQRPEAGSESTRELRLPAMSADAALQALAGKFGYSLLFDYRLVADIRTNPLDGRYTVESALRSLLEGTRLRARLTSRHVITVVRETQAAEAAPWRQPVPRKKAFAIEVVTVTARRVEENLQDTPVSVSAYSGEAPERRQVRSSHDIDHLTPNIQFAANAPISGNNSASQIFIRGIGQTDPTAGVDPGVGLYVDDVYMGQSVGSVFDLRDVDVIQVIRGPQGTLFGRNTVGGAIVVTTREPGDRFGGEVQLDAGSSHLWDGFLAVDIPVSDNLKTRVNIGVRRRHGYVHRATDDTDLGDDNSAAFAGRFVWTPAPDHTMWNGSFRPWQRQSARRLCRR